MNVAARSPPSGSMGWGWEWIYMDFTDGWMGDFTSESSNLCQLQCPLAHSNITCILALLPSCHFTLWSSQTAHSASSGAESTDWGSGYDSRSLNIQQHWFWLWANGGCGWGEVTLPHSSPSLPLELGMAQPCTIKWQWQQPFLYNCSIFFLNVWFLFSHA